MNKKMQKVRSIKRFVRHPATGRYFTDKGVWVSRLQEATNWQDISRAVQLCRRHNLTDIEFILQSDGTRSGEIKDLFPPRKR